MRDPFDCSDQSPVRDILEGLVLDVSLPDEEDDSVEESKDRLSGITNVTFGEV